MGFLFRSTDWSAVGCSMANVLRPFFFSFLSRTSNVCAILMRWVESSHRKTERKSHATIPCIINDFIRNDCRLAAVTVVPCECNDSSRRRDTKTMRCTTRNHIHESHKIEKKLNRPSQAKPSQVRSYVASWWFTATTCVCVYVWTTSPFIHELLRAPHNPQWTP